MRKLGTIATPIAHLNCCSMIGYAPPFLSSVVMSGESFIRSSPDAASRARCCMIFSKSYLFSPNHPAHTGITSPFQNIFYDCSNGPTIFPVLSPTMSAANRRSSFLYYCVISLAWQSGGLIVSLLCLYWLLHAV